MGEIAIAAPSQNVSFSLNLATGAYKAGQRYRLYYVLYDNANAVYLKGHGDIKVE